MSDNIERAIGRIEAKLDALLDTQVLQRRAHEKLASRVGVLERWRTGMVAIGAFVAAVFSAVKGLKGL